MNLPDYDTARFSFGPGILYIGAPGATPDLDVGAVKGGATFSVKRTLLQIEQGSPKALVQQYATKEEVMLEVTGIEWNPLNLSYALGAGVTTDAGGVETIEFGGDMTVNNRALRFLHIQPDGSTIDLHVFKAQSSGDFSVAINDEDTHEFPYKFNGLVAATDFEGNALAANKKMFKIIRTRA